jgi:signal transduction histidine kinase
MENTQSEVQKSTEGSSTHPLYSGHVSDESAVEHIIFIRGDERKRIARELHDSTSQLLAVLQLNLGRLRRQADPERETNISECEKIIAEIGERIRSLGRTPER